MPGRNDIGGNTGADRAPDAALIPRRTMVRAAAWSVPVMALAVASPASAASDTRAITWSAPTYAAAGCVARTGVSLTLTSLPGGAGVVGETVTVTLPVSPNYTFATGDPKAFSGVTGAGGVLSLPSINVPGTGGIALLSAQATGAPLTTATVNGTPATVVGTLYGGPSPVNTNVPAGTVPAGAGFYLHPDGTFHQGGGATIVGGIVMATALNNGGSNWASVIDAAGNMYLIRDGVLVSGPTPTAAGATPTGIGYALAPDGRLFFGSTVVQTGVASAAGVNNTSDNYAGAVTADGRFLQFRQTAKVGTDRTAYDGAVAIGLTYALKGTVLSYIPLSGAIVTIGVGVSSAEAHSRDDGHWVGVITTESPPRHLVYNSGVFQAGSQNDAVAGSKAVGIAFWLEPGGTLRPTNAAGISAASGARGTNNYATVVRKASCEI